jgi:para-aminobenzoate synthetase component 1
MRHRKVVSIDEIAWHEPEACFSAFADLPGVAFLDSGGDIGSRSRYAYLCLDPLEIFVDEGVDLAAVTQSAGALVAGGSQQRPPFLGGAVGFIGYEAACRLGGGAHAKDGIAGVPAARAIIYGTVLAFDRVAQRLYRCRRGGGVERDFCLPAEAAMATAPSLQWRPAVSPEAHMARIARCREYIAAGDIYQANITARFVAGRPAGLHPGALYLAARRAAPAPFGAYFDCGDGNALISTSPERFIALSADGVIETRPIKGTRRRGATVEQDRAAAKALLESGKDRAENLMIVDLMRNDLSRVTEPGSVRVPALCELESFARVHHLVSCVTGRLRAGLHAGDLLTATLPGGSITGAPKHRAMQIIAELEEVPRGPYCGVAFWIGADGAMDSSILIRTLVVTRDEVIAQAGGGIVAESDPAGEWDEVMAKAEPLLRATGTI